MTTAKLEAEIVSPPAVRGGAGRNLTPDAEALIEHGVAPGRPRGRG